jgi:hypothetical protein
MHPEDEHEDPKSMSLWKALLWGIGAPAVSAYFAADIFNKGVATESIGEGRRYVLRDYGATAAGFELVCVAVALHFHYFWACLTWLSPIRTLFRAVAVIGMVGAGVVIIHYIATHPDETVPRGQRPKDAPARKSG